MPRERAMRQQDIESENLLGRAALGERGWTVAAVRRFLGDPDVTRPNPMYRSAAPIGYWCSARVERAESTDEFAAFKAKSAARSAAARAAADVKRQRTLDLVRSVTITIQRFARDTLTRKAIDHFNSRVRSRDDTFVPASADAGREFLDRITVNYLRHQQTRYDETIEMLYRQVGREQAYQLLRSRVLAVIAAEYPYLASECRRQRDGSR